MPSPYQYLTVTGGFAIMKATYKDAIGTGHAQIECAYRSEPIIGPADPNADANTWFDLLNTHLSNYISGQASLDHVDIVMNVPPIAFGTSTRAPAPGGDVGPYMPPNVAFIVKKVTGLVGKENRGRMYIPYLTTDLISGTAADIIRGVDFAPLVTDCHGLFTDLVAAELHPMLIRKTENPLLNYSVELTDLVPERTFATQRRRLRKAAHR
jgi:hypothetical protein